MVGGGQLARMTQPAAIALGVRLRVLAADAADSAAQVVPDAPVGDYRDAAVVGAFAAGCDVVTFDHEHVPAEVLEKLVADGVTVRPGPQALAHTQDKVVMRRRLSALGVPCPRWQVVHDVGDLAAFAADVGWPLVLKTPRGGYDGRGVLVVGDPAAAEPWLARAAGSGLLAEQLVPFDRELAVLVARAAGGQAAAWPVVETLQVDGICREVLAPAPDLDPGLAVRAGEIGLRSRVSSVWSACWRWNVRPPAAGLPSWSTAGHAPAQQRALDDRQRDHRPVRQHLRAVGPAARGPAGGPRGRDGQRSGTGPR
jgi:5-(carboxyamino)imidazole ribonucleotide synthase